MERGFTNKKFIMTSIRTEVIQQEESDVSRHGDMWSKQTNGNVITDASYMGINFISNENNHMMIAGSMNPINALGDGEQHHIAEQGLAIRVVIPDCRVVAHVLETDDIGVSSIVRVDYIVEDSPAMQILLERNQVEDEKQTSVRISVNVVDDSHMLGNNVIYNENGMDNIRMALGDIDGKDTVITGRRVPKQRIANRNKGGNNLVMGILISLGLVALAYTVYKIKNDK